jgi:hypothetical protein
MNLDNTTGTVMKSMGGYNKRIQEFCFFGHGTP